jgi:pilus assembly protein CpaB
VTASAPQASGGPRRRRRALTLIALALVCGGLAASQVAGRVREVESAVGAPVPVVVMARDVAAGAKLRPADLAVRQVPERFASPDALAAPEEAIGTPVAAPLVRGSQLTAAALGAPAGEGPDGPTPGPLRRGQRAVDVAVAGGAALAAGAGAGTRVDVLVSTDPGSGPGTSFLALEGVELLGVGGSPTGGGAGIDAGPDEGAEPTGAATTVTLRVTVRQAVYLTAAQNFAREVRLLPRPPGDRGRSGRTAVSADGL